EAAARYKFRASDRFGHGRGDRGEKKIIDPRGFERSTATLGAIFVLRGVRTGRVRRFGRSVSGVSKFRAWGAAKQGLGAADILYRLGGVPGIVSRWTDARVHPRQRFFPRAGANLCQVPAGRSASVCDA